MAEMVSGKGRRGQGGAEERANSCADRSAIDASQPPANAAGGFLERGWVIANHKLVSFHAAFISSVLSVPACGATTKATF